MTPFSLVVITRNAARDLPRCLKSVPFANDVVVLDSGSDDDTVRVAKSLGARVFTEEWRGFGPQKRRATELAAHDWVLNLDADEALSPAAADELRALLEDPTAMGASDAFAFARLSWHLGRWIRHGGWFPDRQIRLYDRRRANWTDVPVHERVAASSITRLREPLLHWVFDDLSHQVRTNDRYSTLGCEALASRGRRFRLIHLLVKPPVKFIETYVWKRGFRDGVPGFVIAVGAAYSVFLKWAKLWELERRGVSADAALAGGGPAGASAGPRG